MDPWVYAGITAAALAVVVVCCVGVLLVTLRNRAALRHELLAARDDLRRLTEQVDTLSTGVAEARQAAEDRADRHEPAPIVITGVVAERGADATPREAELVHAIETSRPQWLPAKPLRETLVRTVSLGHGLRRALAPENRDRILLEMRAEVRRSRRQRKAEMKVVRRYLRNRRNPAA